MSHDCYEHARQRAHERYNFDLSLSEYKAMCDGIATRFASVVIKSEDNGGNPQLVIALEWNGKKFYVVWSEIRSCITTFLPPEHFGS